MKLSPRSGLFLSAMVLAVAAVWWLWPRVDENREGGSGSAKPNMAAAAGRPSRPVITNAGKKTLPRPDTPEFRSCILEHCAKWLESRGRDAASLVALWDLSGEESLLLEAAEKFPDDPRVCVAMMDYLYQKSEDALPWAERLIKNEPDNPAGHYWKALLISYSEKSSRLAHEGKPQEEALEAFRAAIATGGKPDSHWRDRVVTRREAMLAGGSGVKEAAQAALTAPGVKPALRMFNGQTLAVVRRAIESAKAEGNTGRVEELAALGAAMGEHLGYISAPTLIDELLRNGMVAMSLKELPPDTEYGDDGKTVGERLAEIEAKQAEMKLLRQSEILQEGFIQDGFMNRLTDSQAAEFADRTILHGELAAIRWLNEHFNKNAGQ